MSRPYIEVELNIRDWHGEQSFRFTATQTALERLQPVWKAMEWWHSSDWGEDRLKETLAEYRGETP